MSKRASVLPLALPDREPAMPAGRWLYGALRGEILAGRLGPGARLPGTRELAGQLGLSRGTVVGAFEQLCSEGYVEGSVGSGTHVSSVLPEALLQARRPPDAASRAQPPPRRRLARFGRQVSPLPGLEPRASRAFRSNLPALDLFPATLWAQVAARRLRRVSAGLLTGCDALGYPPLRAAVADYLGASRGVRCTAEQVAIVSGTQEALDLVGRVLLDPGDRVGVEDPGYVGATALFEALGARLVPVRVDADGLDPADPRLRDLRLVYTTPAHQFPLGAAMSLPRRLALLAWARRSGALVFEDDYDSEFRYAGRPIPALQGLDRDGVVLFAGSFSKVLFPSLRLGYLVLPPDLVPRLAAAKSVLSRHAPLLDQAVLCDFIAEGHFGRHLRRMREAYAERLGVLLEEGRARLGGLLALSEVEAGLQTVGWLAPGIEEGAAAEAAAARGVEVVPLGRYARKPLGRAGLQLGFAAVDGREIRRGVRELAVALEIAAGAGPSPPAAMAPRRARPARR